jgi:hypothetical protein
MFAPGKKKTHKAYLWAYCPGVFEGLKAVVYDFADSRAGEHARAFLQRGNEPRKGKLVCDDYAGYKASFTQGITEVGCAAHRPVLRRWRSHRRDQWHLTRYPRQDDMAGRLPTGNPCWR